MNNPQGTKKDEPYPCIILNERECVHKIFLFVQMYLLDQPYQYAIHQKALPQISTKSLWFKVNLLQKAF